jgi:hypothetical protein
MPYIKKDNRDELSSKVRDPRTAGELNYLFTQMINSYLTENGVCYQSFNDIVGALEGAKLEVYRRLIAGYENQKVTENGDAYLEQLIRKCNG